MCPGVLIPGGFGLRGVEGKIKAARFAREHKIPFLGLCLGMQVATIEFARNACGIKDANSTEFDKNTTEPVISLLEEQRGVKNMGASMRLGTWPTKIAKGTIAEKIYASTEVMERHRHRYEFNMKYRDQMNEKGFVISGTSPDGTLAELIELRDHPYFVGCQYHPEFQSNRTNRIRFSKDSFRRVSNIRIVRRALQAIENRRAESLSRNSFCNDKVVI
jgi:CTP synthase